MRTFRVMRGIGRRGRFVTVQGLKCRIFFGSGRFTRRWDGNGYTAYLLERGAIGVAVEVEVDAQSGIVWYILSVLRLYTRCSRSSILLW